LLNRKWNRQ